MSRPIEKLKSGTIQVAVWENNGKQSYTFQHSYKDHNDQWKNTEFIPDYKLPDLLALVIALTNRSVLTGDNQKPMSAYQQQEKVPYGQNPLSKNNDGEEMPF